MRPIFSFLKNLLPDEAVAFSMANTMASAMAMPVTVLLVGHCLTPNQQGLFYTFGSLLALQVLFEMGFSQCLLQFFSHEYASLALVNRRLVGKVSGQPDLRRMAAIFSIARRWYTVIAILVPVVLGPVGHLFFSKNASLGDSWVFGWWSLCLSTGLFVYIQPKTLVLEGCQQVAAVAKIRLCSNLTRLVCLSGGLLAGAGLAAPALATFFSTCVLYLGLNRNWKTLYKQVEAAHTGVLSRFAIWRHEIWPFQWKISLSWVAGYFIFNAFNPIILNYKGAAEAGKFGMAWALIQGIASLASAFGSARVPNYGSLVAQRKWTELHGLWKKAAIQSFCLACLGVATLLSGLILLTHWQIPIAKRVASPGVVALMGLGTIANQIIFAQAFYLRAHKDDPFLSVSLVVAIGVFLCMLFFVPLWGILGAAAAYALITIGVSLPMATWIFQRERKRHMNAQLIFSI